MQNNNWRAGDKKLVSAYFLPAFSFALNFFFSLSFIYLFWIKTEQCYFIIAYRMIYLIAGPLKL